MQIQIKAHFNKQTKDSKKELVQFYVKGEDEHLPELNAMCREVVELRIGLLDTLTAEFVKKTQDSKKTVLEFVVKGGTSAAHSYEFYRLAGSDVELTITESQMSIDEFREQQEEYREGLRGRINDDGTVDLDGDEEDQISFDDLGEDEQEEGDAEDLGDLEE